MMAVTYIVQFTLYVINILVNGHLTSVPLNGTDKNGARSFSLLKLFGAHLSLVFT